MQTYEGECHCGRVRFRVTTDLARVSECNCSVCTKKGILHLVVPPEQFQLLSGQDALSVYQFNTNTAKHMFCRHCGIHSFYVPRSAPDKIDVNVRCLDGVDLDALTLAHFDGQNWERAMEMEAEAHVSTQSPYVDVAVDEHDEIPDGCELRFHAVGAPRAVRLLRYEPLDGPEGEYEVKAANGDGSESEALSVPVDDSGAGTSVLIYGGARGLRLYHDGSRARAFAEPYLLLAEDAVIR